MYLQATIKVELKKSLTPGKARWEYSWSVASDDGELEENGTALSFGDASDRAELQISKIIGFVNKVLA